jgi:hypothetical protein
MKKVIGVILAISVILAVVYALYVFVLKALVDPPPEVVMIKTIEAAEILAEDLTDSNEEAFKRYFSVRCQQLLERSWQQSVGNGIRRGSWYRLAQNLINSDGSRPTLMGRVVPAEGEEETEEETISVELRVEIDGREEIIPFIREASIWRIHLRSAPEFY